jgi:membrane protein YdbS with pleckstrin-like domain
MSESGRSGNRRAENAFFLVLFIALQTVAILFIEDGDSLWQDIVAAFVVAVIARLVTWLAFGLRRRVRP